LIFFEEEECKQITKERNRVRNKDGEIYKINSRRVQRNKRERAKKICRKKKREHEERKLETLEVYGAKGETRKLYKEIRQRKTSFQPIVDFCRDKEGNLVGGEVEIRDRWKEYFEELINMKGTGREGEEGEEIERYTNVESEIETPLYRR
jgi:hypothetical protein